MVEMDSVERDARKDWTVELLGVNGWSTVALKHMTHLPGLWRGRGYRG